MGVELEPGRPFDGTRSELGVADGESDNAVLPRSEEDGSIFVDCGSASEAGTSRGVAGADGGGELGGEDNSISTSATSCASFMLTWSAAWSAVEALASTIATS